MIVEDTRHVMRDILRCHEEHKKVCHVGGFVMSNECMYGSCHVSDLLRQTNEGIMSCE